MDAKIIHKVTTLMKASHNIVVFTGAGISTNAGIPDFRGPEGLYTLIAGLYDLPVPEAIFDIHYFKKHPEPFFHLSKNMLEQNINPTRCHDFVAWLEEENRISLVMTQNIDMLHLKAGSKKVMECHGTFKDCRCLECGKPFTIEEIKERILIGEIPYCVCGGLIKPDVVFFGEQLPADFYRICRRPPEADLLLVLGSSLSVQPAAGFALEIARQVPSILVNLESTPYDGIITWVLHEDLDTFAEIVWKDMKDR